MAKRLRNERRQTIKKQWYLFYCVVLIIPMLAMLFAYRVSYQLLAEAVYDRQVAHLTLVRDLVDAEVRNMSATMLSFGSDQQVREAVSVKQPAEEMQMPLFRSIAASVNNAALNHSLIDHYALYFAESDYLVDGRYLIPRRLISYKDYQGMITETECAAIVANTQTSTLNLMTNADGNLILYMKVPVYAVNKPLYTAAVLSNSELSRMMSSGTPAEEALIAIESLDGQVHLSNSAAQNAAYQADSTNWFHAEVASETLPMRYIYASPTYVVEEKLISYRYILSAFVGASLLLGLIAIRFAVQRQYAPVKRLMQHFSSGRETLENEYKNISDYLLQAQERNDHHFMTDMLLGNVPDSHSFAYVQLILLTHADGSKLLHIDPASAQQVLPNARVVSVYEHTAIIVQHRPLSEMQIAQAISTLHSGLPVYMIYTPNEGQFLHQAYQQVSDMLTTLRFFRVSADKVYRTDAVRQEQSPQIMENLFENQLRTAIFSQNEEMAWGLMQTALDDMRKKCHSGSLLRGSLYAISLLFMRLEASIRSQNPAVPDGVSGDVVRSYRYTSIDQLKEGTAQAIHDMIAAMELQNSRKSNTLYDQIEAYIQSNYQNPDLNVEMLADHTGFSTVYLRRIYKQCKGASITDAIMRLRIDAAKQELAKPSCKVSDVAVQAGFLETGTFIRSFKKLEGITPGAYKNQLQGTDFAEESK